MDATDTTMTKARLLGLLRDTRTRWDALLKEVPEDRLEEPGVAGDWSVKDIIAHLTWHERWYVDRWEEHLRGETYMPQETDFMPFDQRNDLIYQRNRNRPLQEVLAESEKISRRLIELVEELPEEFLIEPQQFSGAPEPVILWKHLRGDVYEHYPEHMDMVRAWLDRIHAGVS